jgi:predicted dithiol-disulfide oxidoreductase (DUF899 family)
VARRRAPHQGQCEGCTTTAWHVKDAIYLNARGVSFAVLTSGRWGEVAPNVEFMGYTQPGHSVRDVAAPVGASMGSITYYLRDGDRVFLAYSTTGRDNEPVNGSFALLDMTPYGLGARRGRPARTAGPRGDPCWHWRTDAAGSATWVRPAAPCRSGPALARPSAGTVTTTDATPIGPAEP